MAVVEMLELGRVEKLSFKEALNATLRRGLDQTLAKPKSKAFRCGRLNAAVI